MMQKRGWSGWCEGCRKARRTLVGFAWSDPVAHIVCRSANKKGPAGEQPTGPIL